MFNVLKFGLCFLLLVSNAISGIPVQTMSLGKQILNAGGLDALDAFHVIEDSTVMVRQELDLMVPLVQFSEIMTAENFTRKKKAVGKGKNNRWPRQTIHYEVTEGIRHYALGLREALDNLSNYTCLSFVETKHYIPRMRFYGNFSGCWAVLGYQSSTYINYINLGDGCRYLGLTQHEVLHVLNIFHEHVRPDRDKYLQVSPKTNKGAWTKRDDVESYGIEYDYRSIMHYWLEGGVKTRDPSYQDKVGRYNFISFRDVQLINAAYGCANKFCLDRLHRLPCPFNGMRITRKLLGQTECQCWCHSGEPNNEDQFVLCSSLEKLMEPVYNLTLESSMLDTKHEACGDLLDNCTSLRKKAFCFTELVKMKNLCTKTCNFCGKGQELCMDNDESCVVMAEAGVCKDKGLVTFMSNLCPKSCGQCTQQHSACDIQKAMGWPDTDIVNSATINNHQWITSVIIFYVLLP